MKKSITVIIPALNEEIKITDSVNIVTDLLEKSGLDYEILAFNDASKDKTGEILDRLASKNPRMKVNHHKVNQGLGGVIQKGFQLSSKTYVSWFSGDNSIDPQSYARVLSTVGDADIVVAFMENVQDRPWIRRVVSRTFTGIMNTLFGLNLKYYNGPSVYPSAMAKAIRIHTQGYDFSAELLIRCLKRGASIKQIPFYHKTDNEKNSKAFSWRNARSVIKTTCILIRDIYFKRKP